MHKAFTTMNQALALKETLLNRFALFFAGVPLSEIFPAQIAEKIPSPLSQLAILYINYIYLNHDAPFS